MTHPALATTPVYTGRVAIITGAGSGIGRATAIAFAAAGASVVLADLSEHASVETLEMVACGSDRAIVQRTDVRIPGDLERLVAETVRAFGGFDFAFNN